MDLRARVTIGCWPVMVRRSRTAPSIALESVAASPTPMFTTIFSNFGIIMTFLYWNLSCMSCLTSLLYLAFRRGTYFSSAMSTP